MKESKGFTLIELLTVIAIAGILLAVVLGAAKGKKQANVDCIAGYAYVHDKQVLNAQGGGVVCVMDSIKGPQ